MRNISVVMNPATDVFGHPFATKRFFDELLNTASAPGRAKAVFEAPVDVSETETHYLVTVDVPGIAKEAIQIELFQDELIISGERKSDEAKATKHVGERRYGKFKRTIQLPLPVEADKVEALYQDGVLKVAVPKAEAAKPRQIEIKAVN